MHLQHSLLPQGGQPQGQSSNDRGVGAFGSKCLVGTGPSCWTELDEGLDIASFGGLVPTVAVSKLIASQIAKRTAASGARFVDEVVPGFGHASAGAGQVVRTLQTGGNKMLQQTADALNASLGQSAGRRDWGRALEGLKNEFGLPGDHHGRILSTGDYVDDAGKLIGNLLDYLP